MRVVALAAGMLFALTPWASAQPFETPRDLLEALYEPYFTGTFEEDETIFRSEALNALYAEDLENTPEGEIGAIDFDPYVDGQDYEIADLVIGEPVVTGDTAVVVVTFTNFGAPRQITFDLVEESGGWKVDDLEGVSPEFTYRLSTIFEEARAYR